MDNSVQYSYDASLPCPDALVFDGLLYERTEDLVDSLPGLHFTRLVPYDQLPKNDDEQVEDVTTKYGLMLVGFNRFIYAKNSDVDPATIEDGVLRTVELNAVIERLNQISASAHAYAYAPPVPHAAIHVTPPHYSRVMPPRSLVTLTSALEPQFDLAPEQRPNFGYVAPSNNNVVAPVISGMIANPGRTHWKAEHVKYLDELMELAMLQLNRPLRISDFKAITEALHRRFRLDGGIVERGYNTVHSHATRKPSYNRLVQRVLPDIGFPDFVPKSVNRQQGGQDGMQGGQ